MGSELNNQLFRAVLLPAVLFVSLNCLSADPTKPDMSNNPMLQKLRRSYLHIYRAIGNDLKKNAAQLNKYQDKLAKEERSAGKNDDNAQERVETYRDLVELYTKLVAAQTTISQMFEKRVTSIDLRLAMETVPRAESQIMSITRKEIKRSWLTFGEVKDLSKRGMAFKTKSPDILPHSRECWYYPKKKGGRK